jgi:hypothetical protein
MADPIPDLIQIIDAQQKTIKHLSKVIGSIGASQFLIFRLLMQYDPKMAQGLFLVLLIVNFKNTNNSKNLPFTLFVGIS